MQKRSIFITKLTEREYDHAEIKKIAYSLSSEHKNRKRHLSQTKQKPNNKCIFIKNLQSPHREVNKIKKALEFNNRRSNLKSTIPVTADNSIQTTKKSKKQPNEYCP